jgi:hypothetical protein
MITEVCKITKNAFKNGVLYYEKHNATAVTADVGSEIHDK